MAQRADAVQEEIAVVEDMVQRLRQLSVAAEDQEAVADWLAYWDEYVSIGHRYAGAIRAERPDYAEIGKEAHEPASYINTFAGNNDLDACIA